ncbi:hypothetical protein CPB84DRAFT_1676317 [Gymnopilus junonius]|uniref:Uncharacterized protein n=1 Tax=Gymnopilus junonius TaxID=109634 RepID=A0A9P5NTE2_GYMJU|nr:hypothetical protein CPB84DRAFT_1676317 [Gymnopilus junonius]
MKLAGSRTEDSFDKPLVTKYPLVKLDADKISDAMAARLATSLLGHVLFLKGQVPFPVMQLSRIPGGKTNTRAAKQRAELLSSFDTISSHLDTTFSALSTALARASDSGRSKLAQAHLAVLVGPSITSAKSKVILGIDGLEPTIWGNTEDALQLQENTEESEEEEDEDEADEESDDDNGEVPDDSDEDDEDSGDSEDAECEEDDDPDEGPSSSSPPPYISYAYAEQQKSLQNADRLLSRTLAMADADGNGLTFEMSPTQTHILIRAPRRFSHPAWIPRQNVAHSLELSLQDFMNNSGLGNTNILANVNTRNTKVNKVEGVWITTRTGLRQNRTEDDDMIWWSWDGKFVGFSDW